MAIPVIPLAVAIAQGVAHVLTKPWPWVFIGLWLVSSKFSWSVFSEEVQNIIWSLWWVVALIILGMIVNSALRVYIGERGKTQRYHIKEQSKK